jgi:tetratricopeptide (TPR) repeat protein
MMLPTIFAGSSSEGLPVARALEQHLETDARINIWKSDLFEPGGTTIETLFGELDRSDYAIFVLTPDDLLQSRHREWCAPRDNVILEVGLFLGRLGRHRTFIVQPRNVDIKLPSDLAGVTTIFYDDQRFAEPGGESGALSSAATTIRRRINNPQPRELDFIAAYIRFIAPETLLTDSYSTILTKHYMTIYAEVENLANRGDWKALLEVKRRLREYFEYSGRYAEGVQFGRRYVSALEALGNPHEAFWTRVKHVGYLLILDGDHVAGRKEIDEVLRTVRSDDTADPELLFYALRYLSISYLRDELGGDVRRAIELLDQAQNVLTSYSGNETTRAELQARLDTNRGNVALASGDPASALPVYLRSLATFRSLGDSEHVGIAHLKIAEAAIAANDKSTSIDSHLDSAESICIRLGWIEGHARVWEQRAYRAAATAIAAATSRERIKAREEAVTAARNASAYFQRIRHREGIARTAAVIEQLKAVGVRVEPNGDE